MSLYVAIFLALATVGIASRARQGNTFVFAVLYIFLVLFVGARFDTGCDFTAYYLRFKYLLHNNVASLSDITEPGYFLLSYATKEAGLGFVWLNVFGAAIFFYYLIKFARNHPRPLLLIALLFPNPARARCWCKSWPPGSMRRTSTPARAGMRQGPSPTPVVGPGQSVFRGFRAATFAAGWFVTGPASVNRQSAPG